MFTSNIITIYPMKFLETHFEEYINAINKNNLHSDLITIGFNRLTNQNSKTFDEGFYNMMGIPFTYRFSKFVLKFK